MKRYLVTYKVRGWGGKRMSSEICSGKSKEELLNFMCPYHKKYVDKIEEVKDPLLPRIGAEHLHDKATKFTGCGMPALETYSVRVNKQR